VALRLRRTSACAWVCVPAARRVGGWPLTRSESGVGGVGGGRTHSCPGPTWQPDAGSRPRVFSGSALRRAAPPPAGFSLTVFRICRRQFPRRPRHQQHLVALKENATAWLPLAFAAGLSPSSFSATPAMAGCGTDRGDVSGPASQSRSHSNRSSPHLPSLVASPGSAGGGGGGAPPSTVPVVVHPPEPAAGRHMQTRGCFSEAGAFMD
jgi:hypothetical protein